MTLLRSHIRHPRSAQPASLTPRQVATAYGFPLSQATGKGYVGGIIELGGGYKPSQVLSYFSNQGLSAPTFVPVLVSSGKNKQDGFNGADGEVQLDMIVAGAVATGATFNVYFAGNNDSDFLAAVKRALAECHGVSLSWGGSENQWSTATMKEFEAVIAEGRSRGVPFFAAAGDSGSQDSSGAGDQTDFPASSPSTIGCGGTRLALNGSTRQSEVVWDDNDTTSATGGGISKAFPGRDVPDVAGNADPETGYEIMIDGQWAVIGGTSAVAPLMLGLHALLWELSPVKNFDFLNLVVTNPQACFDVTSGSNGTFRAGPGRDQTTGFGVPDGTKLLAALRSGIAPPVSSPIPPPVAAPSAFPTDAVTAWLKHKHNHTTVEATAAKALVAYASGLGITLPSA